MHRLVPEKVESAVLLLHGLGANGADLIGLAHEWKDALPTTAFFSPDAPFPCDMAPMGFQWFSLADWSPQSIEAGLQTAKPIADKIIDDVLQEFILKPSQLALVGFSQGTMLSLYTGLQRTEQLAGIVGYSGAMFGNAITSKPPVLLTHGTEDTVVPPQASQIAAQQLQKAGVKVELHMIENLGHGIDSECLDLGRNFLQRAFT